MECAAQRHFISLSRAAESVAFLIDPVSLQYQSQTHLIWARSSIPLLPFNPQCMTPGRSPNPGVTGQMIRSPDKTSMTITTGMTFGILQRQPGECSGSEETISNHGSARSVLDFSRTSRWPRDKHLTISSRA
jgi:hypothetical protein